MATFGVASASYWWGRIAAAGLRLVHELLGPNMPVELLIFADDLEALGADSCGRQGIVLSFSLLIGFGVPLQVEQATRGPQGRMDRFVDRLQLLQDWGFAESSWMVGWTNKVG